MKKLFALSIILLILGGCGESTSTSPGTTTPGTGTGTGNNTEVKCKEFAVTYKSLQAKQSELEKMLKTAKAEDIEKMGELTTELSNLLKDLEKNCG
jgi:hypothetical protein